MEDLKKTTIWALETDCEVDTQANICSLLWVRISNLAYPAVVATRSQETDTFM
jgi:hypothetical protein